MKKKTRKPVKKRPFLRVCPQCGEKALKVHMDIPDPYVAGLTYAGRLCGECGYEEAI